MEDSVVDIIKKDIYRPEERGFIFDHFKDPLGEGDAKTQQAIYDRIKDVPGIDPWIVNMVAGRLYIKKALDARGWDWAQTVTEQGWK